jgi:predicted metalloprotease with PDZ domain
MRDSLLWVYEGQTQYWGFVLAARSGLLTKQQALDALAGTAATYDHRVGREWRPLQDTTNDPIAALRRPWHGETGSGAGLLFKRPARLARHRYFTRERVRGERRWTISPALFAINDGSHAPVTYTFDDVVNALNRVPAHDWSKFRARGSTVASGPARRISRGGYKLVYTETPSDYFRLRDPPESYGSDLLARDGRRQ